MMSARSLISMTGLLLIVSLVIVPQLSIVSASAATRDPYPSAPRNVTATAGIESATLHFAAPISNGGSRILWYYARVFGTSSPTYKCDITRCPIKGLRGSFKYRFVVSAVNKFGHGAYSGPSNSVIPASPNATVTFNANGGSGTMPIEEDPDGATVVLTSNTFTRPGYAFNDWNTNASGTGTSFANGTTNLFTSPVTLYAQWTAISANWSGYVLPGNSLFTDVSAEWIVPTLNCSETPNGQSATWVGTGGVTWSDGGSSGSLLQTGTVDNCVNGEQQDTGVFELFPSAPNYDEAFSNFPVSAGNVIKAEVFENSSGKWASFLENLSTVLQGVFGVGICWDVEEIATDNVVGGLQGLATGTSYSGAYSAEWIVEDPTDVATYSNFPFADFQSVTFSDMEVSLPTGWTLPTSDGEEIVQNGEVLATPSAINNNGGFTVSYG